MTCIRFFLLSVLTISAAIHYIEGIRCYVYSPDKPDLLSFDCEQNNNTNTTGSMSCTKKYNNFGKATGDCNMNHTGPFLESDHCIGKEIHETSGNSYCCKTDLCNGPELGKDDKHTGTTRYAYTAIRPEPLKEHCAKGEDSCLRGEEYFSGTTNGKCNRGTCNWKEKQTGLTSMEFCCETPLCNKPAKKFECYSFGLEAGNTTETINCRMHGDTASCMKVVDKDGKVFGTCNPLETINPDSRRKYFIFRKTIAPKETCTDKFYKEDTGETWYCCKTELCNGPGLRKDDKRTGTTCYTYTDISPEPLEEQCAKGEDSCLTIELYVYGTSYGQCNRGTCIRKKTEMSTATEYCCETPLCNKPQAKKFECYNFGFETGDTKINCRKYGDTASCMKVVDKHGKVFRTCNPLETKYPFAFTKYFIDYHQIGTVRGETCKDRFYKEDTGDTWYCCKTELCNGGMGMAPKGVVLVLSLTTGIILIRGIAQA